MYTKIFEELLRKQNEVNIISSGSAYLCGTTDKGKEIDWHLAILMELAELIDSFPWKHWKNIADTVDMENVKIELVDILHFILSMDLHEVFQKRQTVLSPDLPIHSVHMFSSEKTWNSLSSLGTELAASDDVGTNILRMLKTWLKGEYTSAASHYLNLFTVVKYMEDNDIFTFEEMLKIYLGKNTLNAFRQKHGYKEGTYVKTWGVDSSGENLRLLEDNVYMLHAIENIPLSEDFVSELDKLLEAKYIEVITPKQ